MHETALMRGVVSDLERLARANDSRRIVAVTLQIHDSGKYPGEHFIEHLHAVAAGTVVEGATIDVEMVANPEHVGAPQIMIKRIEVPAKPNNCPCLTTQGRIPTPCTRPRTVSRMA